MTIPERCEELGLKFQSVLNRITYILESNEPVSEDEKLVFVSLTQLVGEQFISIGEAMQTENEDAISASIDQATGTHDRIKALIDSHPIIVKAKAA